MPTRTQQQRAEVTNTPPADGVLLPGQMYLELADPVRLWVGVPATMLATQKKLVFDASIAAQALNKSGDTATGLITFSAGINVVGNPCTVPMASQDASNSAAASTGWVMLQGSNTAPVMDGNAIPGVSLRWARGDHVHPSDSSRAPLNSPGLTGVPTAPTPPQDDATTKLATTQYVINQASTVVPLVDAPIPVVGTSLRYARADHVHPTDLSRSQITISDTPPASPLPGNMWFNSLDTQLYIYYSDPTSTQWVVAINQNGALSEAPTDGNTYGRSNSNWVTAVPTTGGTLTGPLVLAADPTVALGAATKQYVDAGPATHNTGRSLIHNGLFIVAQRSAGPFTANGYTLDRWTLGWGAGDTASVSQVAFSDAARTQIGDESAQFALVNNFTGASGAGNYITISQATEDVRRLGNKTVTASFWAAAASGTPKLGVSMDQYFGAGGSPSPTVSGNGQAVTLSTTWTRYSLTFTLPSVIGKTTGTSGSFTSLVFWYSSGSTYAVRSGNIGVQSGNIQIWGVQLEIGSQATPLEKLGPRVDMSNCQRFFCLLGGMQGMALLNSYCPGGAAAAVTLTYPNEMRVAPTVALQGPASAPNASGWQVDNVSTNALRVLWTVTGTGASGLNSVSLQLSADL